MVDPYTRNRKNTLKTFWDRGATIAMAWKKINEKDVEKIEVK